MITSAAIAALRAAVAVVDVLNDLLAVLMREIDVDVGNFLALFGHEAFEEQIHADRIDRGDAERVADRGVRRRTAALAEHAELGRPRCTMSQTIKKVAGQIHLGDDAEFVFELAFDVRLASGVP